MLKPTLGKHRGVYVAIFAENGKRLRRSLGTNDKAEAERRLAHLALTDAIIDRQVQKTIKDLFELYLSDKRLEGKPTERIAFAFRNLESTFGHLYPQYVTKELTKAYRADRKASAGTIYLELNYLRMALSWAYKNKLLDREVFVDRGSKPPPRTDYISKEQFQKLLAATEYPHLILFMILAVTTGARSNALLDLTWNRVDFNRRIIDLRNPEKSATAKGRAVIPINDTALRYLETARKGAQTPYVIEYANAPIKHIRHAMERISERAKLKVTAHMFRHSAAVWMAEGGVPMSEIAQFLGHSNTAITEHIYARYSPQYLRNAAKHLEL